MSEEKKVVELEAPQLPLDLSVLRATLKVLHKATGQQYEEGMKPMRLRALLHDEIVAFTGAENPYLYDKVGGLESFSDKLDSCFGALFDLRKGTCAVCPDQSQCLSSFFGNLKDGFVTLGMKHGIKPPEETIVSKKKVEGKKKRAVEDDDMVAMFDEKNPGKPGTQRHLFYERILSWGSMSVGSLANIGKQFFPETSKEGLVEDIEKAGIGCLAKDLPADYVASMPKKQRRALGL